MAPSPAHGSCEYSRLVSGSIPTCFSVAVRDPLGGSTVTHPQETRFCCPAVGAARCPRRSNHGRPPDRPRHLTFPKYQRRGCTQTRATTQQKRAEKINPSDPFWQCCCGRSKASNAPKLLVWQTSRSYQPPHVPKVSAPWVHSKKHHNTANMGAVMNNLSDFWFH